MSLFVWVFLWPVSTWNSNHIIFILFFLIFTYNLSDRQAVRGEWRYLCMLCTYMMEGGIPADNFLVGIAKLLLAGSHHPWNGINREERLKGQCQKQVYAFSCLKKTKKNQHQEKSHYSALWRDSRSFFFSWWLTHWGHRRAMTSQKSLTNPHLRERHLLPCPENRFICVGENSFITSLASIAEIHQWQQQEVCGVCVCRSFLSVLSQSHF